jgi:hypothetical protein
MLRSAASIDWRTAKRVFITNAGILREPARIKENNAHLW